MPFTVGVLAAGLVASLGSDAGPTNEVSCGPVAMAMAFKLLDAHASNDELSRLLRSDGSTSFADLTKLAIDKGLYAAPVRMTPSQLASLREVAILQLVSRPTVAEPWREHFTVFAGPGKTPGTAVIFDPVAQLGRGEVPLKIVCGKWTGAALVLSDHPLSLDKLASEGFSPRLRFARDSVVGAGAAWLTLGAAWCYAVAKRARRARHGAV